MVGNYGQTYEWQQQQQGQQGLEQQQQWQFYGYDWATGYGTQQQSTGGAEYVGQPPPPPPTGGASAPPLPAYPSSSYYGGGYGQWSQQYGGTYPNAQQQYWDWQRHAPAAGASSHAHASHQRSGYWQSGVQASPAIRVRPPEPLHAPAGVSNAGSSAIDDSGRSPSHQQQQHSHYPPEGSYSAVPPPPSLTQPLSRAFSIRPQMPMPKPPESSNPLVAAFNVAAAKLASCTALAGPAPAYTHVQVGSSTTQQQQPQQQADTAAVASQQWPPALKAYVERAFKACDVRRRSKLQEVLKKVIADAQTAGELWTRDWQALPLPDLSQPALDAAAVLAEVAAVSGPAASASVPPSYAGHGGLYTAATTSREREQQYPRNFQRRQQQHLKQQQKELGRPLQQQQVGTGDWQHNRRGHKRSHSSSESGSDRSDFEEQHGSYAEQQRRKQRAGRFVDARYSTWKADDRQRNFMVDEEEDEDLDWVGVTIKGTCKELDKSYFRLTSAPDPATVRPEPVLRLALDRLVGLLRAKKVNYFYALDQFKGMRQDCTVQHLRNDLAVQMYEAHARAALEYGDHAEYNQCQAQLRVLYSEGLQGSKSEMLSYRIIYQSVHAHHGELLQLLNTLKHTNKEDAALPDVSHALAVRAALAGGNFVQFFRLYANAPALGRALMDVAVPKVRFDALRVICKSFLPSVPLPFVASLLGFVASASGGAAGESVGWEPKLLIMAAGEGEHAPRATVGTGASNALLKPLPGCMEPVFPGEHAAKVDIGDGCKQCIEWLMECGAVVVNAEHGVEAMLDCKPSAGQLKMPGLKPKVAHADENLDVGAFLKTFTLPLPK